jgi:thiol-disulfide isomerase/thioredoxin
MQPSQNSEPIPLPPPLLVACLCAEWCGTCKDYRAPFLQLQTEFPSARFMWIDIEDEAELVDPIEVDDFPTLLIAAHGQPQFFGTVTPHLDTLRRLIQSALEPGARPLAQVQVVHGLVQRLSKRLISESA